MGEYSYTEYGLLLEDGSIWTAPFPAELQAHINVAEVLIDSAKTVGIAGRLVQRTTTVTGWVEVEE